MTDIDGPTREARKAGVKFIKQFCWFKNDVDRGQNMGVNAPELVIRHCLRYSQGSDKISFEMCHSIRFAVDSCSP